MTQSTWTVDRWALAAGLIGLVLMSGCGVIHATRDTSLAIERAGYASATVNASRVNGVDTVHVMVTANQVLDTPDLPRVGRIVWATFHYRIDQLNVELRGASSRLGMTVSHLELVNAFGARDPAFDRHSFTGAIANVGRTALIVLGVGGLLFVIFIVVVIVLVANAGRRRRATTRTSGPWGPPFGAPEYGPPWWTPAYGPRPGPPQIYGPGWSPPASGPPPHA